MTDATNLRSKVEGYFVTADRALVLRGWLLSILASLSGKGGKVEREKG